MSFQSIQHGAGDENRQGGTGYHIRAGATRTGYVKPRGWMTECFSFRYHRTFFSQKLKNKNKPINCSALALQSESDSRERGIDRVERVGGDG